jgi:protein SCO1/2
MHPRSHRSARPYAALLLALGLSLTVAAPAGSLVGGVRLQVLPQRWRDEGNRPVSLAAPAGVRVVLTMAYANCHRICPMTIDSLKRLQGAFDARGESAEFFVIGYDPENEDPATWRQYRRSHHLDRPNWHFVTGSADDTAQLAHQLHFELWKYDEHVMHESRVLVFDARGLLARELGPETQDWSAAL